MALQTIQATPTGLEPAPSSSTVRRSAFELRRHFRVIQNESTRVGSNHRPPGYQPGALPLSYASNDPGRRGPQRSYARRPPPFRGFASFRSSLVKDHGTERPHPTAYHFGPSKSLVQESNLGLPLFRRALCRLSEPALPGSLETASLTVSKRPGQSPRPDSNRRVPVCKTGALPTELRGIVGAPIAQAARGRAARPKRCATFGLSIAVAGFEPAVSGL